MTPCTVDAAAGDATGPRNRCHRRSGDGRTGYFVIENERGAVDAIVVDRAPFSTDNESDKANIGLLDDARTEGAAATRLINENHELWDQRLADVSDCANVAFAHSGRDPPPRQERPL